MIEDRLRESLTGKFLSMRGFIHIRIWKFERKDIIGKLAGQTKRMRKRERVAHNWVRDRQQDSKLFNEQLSLLGKKFSRAKPAETLQKVRGKR